MPDAHATHDGCLDNPTRIDKPFWKYMISIGGMLAFTAGEKLRIPGGLGNPKTAAPFLLSPLWENRDNVA